MNGARKRGIVVLVIWAVYVLFLLLYYESAVTIMANKNILVSSLLYIFYNPAYMLLMYSSYQLTKKFGKRAYKRVIGSITLIFALDLVAMPRFLMNEVLKNGAVSTTNFGSIVMTNLNKILPSEMSFYVFYIILPIALFVISMELFGVADFVKNIKNGQVAV